MGGDSFLFPDLDLQKEELSDNRAFPEEEGEQGGAGRNRSQLRMGNITSRLRKKEK